MKFILSLLFIIAASQTVLAKEDSNAERYSFQPCSSWQYNFNTSAYVCSFTGLYIEVPDSSEVQDLKTQVASLQAKNQDLEQRVAKLEKKP